MTAGGFMEFGKRCQLVILGVLCAIALPGAAGEVHHDLKVRIETADNRLEVVDRVTLAEAVTVDETGAYRFVLHAGLQPRVVSPGWRLRPEEGPVEADFLGINATTDTVGTNVPLEAFTLIPADGAGASIELVYGGVINHELETQGEE
jgi:hypothetical protein